MNENMKISNCCSAPLYDESEICSECKEGCLPIDEDDETICHDCGADLITEVNDLDNEGRFQEVITKCPDCDC